MGKFALAAMICFTASFNESAYASTCLGETPCNACKSCSACKRCAVRGLTCGVCKGGGDGREKYGNEKERLAVVGKFSKLHIRQQRLFSGF